MTVDPLQRIRDTLAEEDDLVDVTGFGSPTEYRVASSATERAEALARSYYLADRITIDELEAALDDILREEVARR